MSKPLFFLLRGSFIFQQEAWSVFFYAIKKAAVDIKMSFGISYSHAGCCILENKIVCLSLTQ